jgi:hypothetical protein
MDEREREKRGLGKPLCLDIPVYLHSQSTTSLSLMVYLCSYLFRRFFTLPLSARGFTSVTLWLVLQHLLSSNQLLKLSWQFIPTIISTTRERKGKKFGKGKKEV